MQTIADPGRRTNTTQAKAIDGFQPNPLASGSLGGGNKFLHTPSLAGFGAAQFDAGARIGFGRKVVIEADHAVHFGPAEVKFVGDDPFRLGIDAAEFALDIMQDRQERTFAAPVAGADFGDAFGPRHAFNRAACQPM